MAMMTVKGMIDMAIFLRLLRFDVFNDRMLSGLLLNGKTEILYLFCYENSGRQNSPGP